MDNCLRRIYLISVALAFILLNKTEVKGSNSVRFFNVKPEEFPELAYVLSMHKDADGYMWFGTYNGLIRYDGNNFRIFSFTEKDNSLSNSVVHVITEDKNGNLWIGTEHGLNKFNKQTNKFINYTQRGEDNSSLRSTHIRTLHIDSDSIIWVGTRGGGLSKFNIEKGIFSHFKADTGLFDLRSDDINCFYPVNDSIFYIGTENGGLTAFNKQTLKFKSFKSLGNKTVSNVHVDAYNTIWVGIWDNGLYKKAFGDTVFSRVDLIENGVWTPKDIKEDVDRNLWIGTFGNGLIKFDLNTRKVEHLLANEQSDKSIADNRIWSLLIDNSQLVWVGSFGNGVSVYDKYSNKFPFTKTNIESVNNIGSILSATEGENGDVWLLTAKGIFLYSLKTKTFKPWKLSNDFNKPVHRVFYDFRGHLWLGCDGFLVQVDTKTNKYKTYSVHQFAAQRKDYIINYIEQDKDSNIWFSIYEGGLFKLPNSEIGFKKTGKKLNLQSYVYKQDSVVIPTNIIWMIKPTLNGDIWISTNSGFCKLNPQTNKFESINNVAHSSLYSKHPGVVWLGSLGSGLGRYEISTNKLTYFSKDNGLSSDVVFGVYGDNEGYLWLITQKGITRFNPLNEEFKNYDATDGIEDVQFSMNSGLLLYNGEMLFYSSKGFTLFNPTTIKDNPSTPKVVFTDIKLYNKSITLELADSVNRRINTPLSKTKSIEIGHKDKMLTINFNALLFSSPDHVEYAYQLHGFDKEWNYTNAQQANATYTNLAGGEYLFKVKASNADGIWSNETSDLEIVVIPPVWQRFYFKLISFVLVSLIIIIVIRIQYQKIKSRYAFEEIKKEREIIRLKIEQLDAELEKKNNELTSKTLVLLHKNEKIKELKNQINDVLDKVSKASQPKVYSLLRFIKNEFENDQYWDQFEQQFNMTHNNFIDRFKEAYPKISHKDLKVCAYVRMDLSNQEIANLLNVTIRGVEASRHRIRKKIKLDRTIPLNDYIRNF